MFRRRAYANHPEVNFKPGPFYMGDGLLGWTANVVCIVWTIFVCVIFSLPDEIPVTPENMNYSSVITVGVVFLSLYVPSFLYCVRRRRADHSSRSQDLKLLDLRHCLRSIFDVEYARVHLNC